MDTQPMNPILCKIPMFQQFRVRSCIHTLFVLRQVRRSPEAVDSCMRQRKIKGEGVGVHGIGETANSVAFPPLEGFCSRVVFWQSPSGRR
jgi:hypothetical protein